MITLFALTCFFQEPAPVKITPVIKLSADKGIDIRKEPAYEGTPLYGRLKDSERTFTVVVAYQGDSAKLFVDFNRNGDLTDDSAPDWRRIESAMGRPLRYETVLLFAAKSKRGAMKTFTYSYCLTWTPGESQLKYDSPSTSTPQWPTKLRTRLSVSERKSTSPTFNFPGHRFRGKA